MFPGSHKMDKSTQCVFLTSWTSMESNKLQGLAIYPVPTPQRPNTHYVSFIQYGLRWKWKGSFSKLSLWSCGIRYCSSASYV